MSTALCALFFPGDPSVFGNLPPHPAVGEALKNAVDSNRYHGMPHSAGILEVRESLAQQLSKYPTKYPLKADVRKVVCVQAHSNSGPLDFRVVAK